MNLITFLFQKSIILIFIQLRTQLWVSHNRSLLMRQIINNLWAVEANLQSSTVRLTFKRNQASSNRQRDPEATQVRLKCINYMVESILNETLEKDRSSLLSMRDEAKIRDKIVSLNDNASKKLYLTPMKQRPINNKNNLVQI